MLNTFVKGFGFGAGAGVGGEVAREVMNNFKQKGGGNNNLQPCNNCQALNEAGMKFCGSCGAEIVAAPPVLNEPAGIRCDCGAINEESRKFCSGCGEKLSIPETPAGDSNIEIKACECGEVIDPDKKFCRSCGAEIVAAPSVQDEIAAAPPPEDEPADDPIIEIKACECGAEIGPDKKFCGSCGAKLM